VARQRLAMPDTHGAPLLGEVLGEASSCEQCGGPLAGAEHDMVNYEDTGQGWEQLCTSCSETIHSVESADDVGTTEGRQ